MFSAPHEKMLADARRMIEDTHRHLEDARNHIEATRVKIDQSRELLARLERTSRWAETRTLYIQSSPLPG